MNNVDIFIAVLHCIPKPNRNESADSRSLNKHCSLIFERKTVGFQQGVSNCILVTSYQTGCYKPEIIPRCLLVAIDNMLEYVLGSPSHKKLRNFA
jgi:hypothetical protein